MNDPDTACGPDGAQSLPAPPGLQGDEKQALFLDFDGTLVDIAPHPDAVVVSAELPGILSALSDRLEGRLALVTGRSLGDLEKHLGHLEVAMAGSHGGEFRAEAGGAVQSLAEPIPMRAVDRLRSIAESHGGLLVEPKPFSAAMHYRARPEAETDVLARAGQLAQDEGLTLKRGKMVVELVMPGSDKGSAVSRFMALPGFAGARPVFVGDDITDEDAFGAVLAHRGAGVLVGPQRETRALYRLPGVNAVHDWLKAGLK